MTGPLRAFRVGVVGARRVRQGTGAFIAEFLHAAGVKVVAVLGTSEASAEEAAQGLAERCGITAAPYVDFEAMCGKERLDALVVASPAVTHLPWLDRALKTRLHVLCEKPLTFGEHDFSADATRLVPAFAEAGLCLRQTTQWRFAIASYMTLFTDVSPRAAASFEMHLSPTVAGAAVLPDSMPHALSILDHLYPSPEEDLRDVSFDVRSPTEVVVRFVHPGRGGVAASVRLVTCPNPPRPLSFGFDGHVAHRAIREPGHRTFLQAGEGAPAREVPLPDPLESLVKDFVATVRKGPPFKPDSTLVPGARHLLQLVRAWPAGAGVVGGA